MKTNCGNFFMRHQRLDKTISCSDFQEEGDGGKCLKPPGSTSG